MSVFLNINGKIIVKAHAHSISTYIKPKIVD